MTKLGVEFEHLGAFRSPKCGNDGSRGELRFVEDIACYRPVVGVKNGGLKVDGLYRTEGYDDDATNQRFECRGRLPSEHYDECGHEWPVPPWLYERIDGI